MSFTPDAATAAWVLTGALSLCTLVFIPSLGFLLAREYGRRDQDSKETLARLDGFAAMLDEVKGMIHETKLLVTEHRLWVSEGFIPRSECNKNLCLLREDMRDLKATLHKEK